MSALVALAVLFRLFTFRINGVMDTFLLFLAIGVLLLQAIPLSGVRWMSRGELPKDSEEEGLSSAAEAAWTAWCATSLAVLVIGAFTALA